MTRSANKKLRVILWAVVALECYVFGSIALAHWVSTKWFGEGAEDWILSGLCLLVALTVLLSHYLYRRIRFAVADNLVHTLFTSIKL